MALAGRLTGHIGEVADPTHSSVVVVAKLILKLEHENIKRVLDREISRWTLVYRFYLEDFRRPLCEIHPINVVRGCF